MLFFVIEDFHGSDRKEIYRRFRDKGRLKPEELVVHHSWIAGDMSRCFMLVEADDVTILQRWVVTLLKHRPHPPECRRAQLCLHARVTGRLGQCGGHHARGIE